MARRFFCTVLQVKPYSGYYRSCPSCKRKLRTAELTWLTEDNSRYWCRGCRVDYGAGELELYYCLILSVTDYPTGTLTVSLFGRILEKVFGTTAAQMHKLLNEISDESMSGQELMIKTLETLLIGSCVELTFNDFNIGQRREQRTCVATGVKVLGPNGNENVFSLLTNQMAPLSSRDSCTAAITTQQHSTTLDSSSFLYDTSSQADNVDLGTSCPILKLESFLQYSQQQSVSTSPAERDVTHLADNSQVDDSLHLYDREAAEEIVLELETEWESTQQQLSDIDLAFSKDVLSELQQTFTLSSREASPAPSSTQIAVTTCQLTPTSSAAAVVCASSGVKRRLSNSETPELFSGHKRPSQQLGGPMNQFTPEMFDYTPFVCRCSNRSLSTRSALLNSSSKESTLTPKRFPLHNCTSTTPAPLSLSTPLPPHSDSYSTVDSQEHSRYTPLTQNRLSFDLGCSTFISSPDLFSQNS